MALIRSLIGARPAPSHDWASKKIEEQEARVRALDAQVDAIRSPTVIHKRRATDRP